MQRAVAYIRVSTKSEAQRHSFECQIDHWKNSIVEKAGMQLCGIYADRGITGSSAEKRVQFQSMLESARKKEFDVIYTKSVARFARNTEELLNIVRELRELGISVIFEKENINTLDPRAELFLTIAASVAENDLRIYSNNQKWSMRSKFKQGQIVIGHQLLGYRLDKETNTLIIDEEEAETVRKIFKLYLDGYGMLLITRQLVSEGRKNANGIVKWDRNTIRYILTNEKYKGAVLSQKTVTTLGETVLNNGVAKKYYMEGTHEKIVSEEDFDKVQEEIRKRCGKNLVGRKREKYTFTGMFECGQCGNGYSHKMQNRGKPYQTEVWVCSTQSQKGKCECDCTRIKDSVLKEKFVECFNEFVVKTKGKPQDEGIAEELTLLAEEEQRLVKMKVNYLLTIADFNKEVAKIRVRIKELKIKLDEYKIKDISRKDYEFIEEFSEEKMQKFLRKIIIHKNIVTFEFVNGNQISKAYTNIKYKE